MTYQDLKNFCDSLNEDQLKIEVFVARVDNTPIKVECGHISEEDEYFDHEDSLGTLEIVKEENPDDWEDIIADATLVPKGTVMLCDEG